MSASIQKMLRLTSRDAPKFDSKEPENLCHFLGQMEDLFSNYSITNDDKKKKLEYDGGTFTEFKDTILKNYPEVADVETGTWERLTHILHKFLNLGADECKLYLKFERRFLTEAKKLQKPPVLVTNRELVEKFTESLSPMFQENIMLQSSIKHGIKNVTSMPAGAGAAPVVMRPIKRCEDMHTLDEVVAEADDITLNSSTSYLLSATSGSVSLTGATSGSGIKAEFEDVKQQVAALLDCIDNVQKHAVEGLLKFIDRKFMMMDGTPIPHEPAHLCPMDWMLALLNKKQEQIFWEDVSGPAGIFNINVPDNASLYVNKPQDARDEVIDKLHQDLQWQGSAHVPTSVQLTIQPQLLQAPVPSTSSQPMNQSFDPNVFLNQMRSLFTQASSQNATSGQNFEGQVLKGSDEGYREEYINPHNYFP
ncbi:hypothetical protein ARMGADRAFT_1036701 [Armillaria gallica]|uniref:Uncharacterized protein n=1 Tax=Armillaria gallica TaxID=47427 RepID=A0A2H3DBY8_ARMGA|nr:hypothetical protein ARMGADRAFT_1036701 [Armillaria gallica]